MGIKELGRPMGNPLASSSMRAGQTGDIGTISTHFAPASYSEVEADGRSISKVSNPLLFSAIGDAYSVADFSQGFTTVAMPSSASWLRVTYGSSRFVAISQTGLSAISTDLGLTWAAGSNLPSATWSSVAYGNGVFVAVASGSTIAASSSDGSTWIQRTLPTTASWSSVAYGNGVFVAVASGTTVVAVSSDGITWTQFSISASAGWSSVAYGNGVFVAVASGSTIASFSVNNGATWAGSNLPASSTWSSVAYGNGVFVAVSSSGAATAVTGDGIEWGAASTSIICSSVVYGAGSFIMLPTGGTSLTYMLKLYNLKTTTLSSSLTWTGSAYGNGVLVILSSGANVVRGNITSASNFNLPTLKPNDLVRTAYVKIN